MSAIFLGLQSIEQAPNKRWNPTSGDGLARRWRGSEQMMMNVFNSLRGASGVLDLSMDQDGDGPVYMVTATFGAIEDGIPETDASIPYFWELAGNMIDKSVYENPSFSALNAAQKAAVKKAVDENTANATFAEEAQTNLYNEIIGGRDTYQTSAYVLRINRTFSSLYENTVSTTDVSKLYTYAQIQAEASSIASAISVAVAANVPASGYWLKQAPILSELSNRKLQLNQEWWWSDTWSTVLYNLKA